MKHPFFDNIEWDTLLRKEIKAPIIPTEQGITDFEYFHKEFTSMSPNSHLDSQGSCGALSSLSNWDNFSYDHSTNNDHKEL